MYQTKHALLSKSAHHGLFRILLNSVYFFSLACRNFWGLSSSDWKHGLSKRQYDVDARDATGRTPLRTVAARGNDTAGIALVGLR